MKKIQFFLFLLVIFLAIILRFYKLNKAPVSLFSDEVDLGYQAYSFLKTGKDYFGNRWPISFHSFADYRAPLYLYAASATIYFFGENEWGVRVPAAVFGILGIISFFLLLKQISKNFYFAFWGSLFLTLLPWHFHYSRAGFEATAIFFLVTFGLLFFFKSLRKKSFGLFLFSVLVLSLGFYTYATARLFLPLLGISAFLIFRKEILGFSWKKIAITLLIVVLALLPFLRDSIFGGGLHRFSYLNIFSDSNLKFEVNRQRLVDTIHGQEQVVGMKTTPLAYFFHNKPTSWVWTIINNYFSSFSTSFLFLKGDPNLRHGVGNFGGILVVMAPFLVLGVVKCCWLIKEPKKGIVHSRQALFWLAFLFLAPIPSSITYDGGVHATRLFLMILPLIVLITLGFWEFLSWFPKHKIKVLAAIVIVAFVCLNSLYYFHQYFYHFPIESEKYWHFGFKDGVTEILKIAADDDEVIFSDSYEPSLIHFLFWSEYNPTEFSIKKLEEVKEDWFEGKKIGRYYFGHINNNFFDYYVRSLKMKKPVKNYLLLCGRNDLGFDLEKYVPPGLKIKGRVLLPSREPIFYLVTEDKEEIFQNEEINP